MRSVEYVQKVALVNNKQVYALNGALSSNVMYARYRQAVLASAKFCSLVLPQPNHVR
jgi:hypothetical protein